MTRSDEPAVLAFAQKLPTHDLLFLPRNISQPKVLSAWVNEIDRGAIVSLIAIKGGTVVGCGTLMFFWEGHRVTPISPTGFLCATGGAFVLLFFYRLLSGYFFVEGEHGPRPHAFRRSRRREHVSIDD